MNLTTRLAMQGQIQRRYPELLRQYTAELCRFCHFAGIGMEGCGQGLLSVTISGEKCPYYLSPNAVRRDNRIALIGRR
jgi:hypothetical protein